MHSYSMTFSGSELLSSQLATTISVPRGDYLVAWRGVLVGDAGRSGNLLVNTIYGTTLDSIGVSANVGGYFKLSNVSTIKITGTGTTRFVVAPAIRVIAV